MSTGPRAHLYWLAPTTVMLVWGAVAIHRPGLWADELATWGAVRLPWTRLGKLLSNTDAVNGTYYVLVKLWTSVAGDGETALRLPSLVAMAAAVAATAVLGARLWTPRVGMAAGLLFALFPMASRYAQEARAYAFVIALALIATVLLLTPRRRGVRTWLWYGLSIVAMGAFNLVALLLLAAHAAVVLLWKRDAIRSWLTASAAAVIALSPLLWLGSRQISQTSWIDPISMAGLFEAPKTLWGADLVAALALGAIAICLLRHRDKVTWQLTLLAAVPVLCLAALSLMANLWWPRYLLYTVPFAAILAAGAWAGLSRRHLTTALTALTVLAVGVAGSVAQWDIRRDSGHSHDTRGVAAVIAAGYQPGDGMAVALHEPVVPWEARDLVEKYIPSDSQPRDIFAVTSQRDNGQLLATECGDPDACLDDTARLWVIRFQHPEDVLSNLGQPKEDLLRAEFDIAQTWQLRGMSVGLLTRK